MITSLQNDRIKHVHALQTQAKARRKERQIALEGTRLVADAYDRGGSRPLFVLYDPDAADRTLVDRLERQRVTLYPVTTEVLKHVSVTEQPQGIVAIFPMPDPALPADPRRVLIVDDLRDPGNLGTLLRTAAAAGVEAVLLSPGSVDAYNPKALRGGMGAHFRLPVVERSWADIAAYAAPLRVYLADMEGDVAYDHADWSAPWALIIGNEAHGASVQAAHLAHQRVTIPMEANAESLNAAIAAGILLFEARRQG